MELLKLSIPSDVMSAIETVDDCFCSAKSQTHDMQYRPQAVMANQFQALPELAQCSEWHWGSDSPASLLGPQP